MHLLRPTALRPMKVKLTMLSLRSAPVSMQKRFIATRYGKPTVNKIEFTTRATPAIPLFHKIEVEEKIIEQICISPGETNNAISLLSRFFSQFKSDVFGILTYVDHTTPTFLEGIDTKLGLKLLTSATSGERSNIAREFETKHNQRPSINLIELTLMDNLNMKPWFHERWLSDGKILVDIGIDLKKGSLGIKEHTIILSSTYKDSERIKKFEWYWNSTEEDISQHYNKKAKKETIYQK